MKMHVLWTYLLAALSTPPAFATALVSGFDDVIRQAQVQQLSEATLRIFQADEGFAGMPNLYEAIVASREGSEPPLDVISGITTWYTGRAERLLQKEGYPPFRLHFRNWLTEWSIADFKMREIHKVLLKDPNEKFVFVFDNSDPSFAIARRIQAECKAQTLAIYLRKTVERADEPATRSFVTAFDIAIEEMKDGRLSATQVLSVSRGILNEPHFDRVIPTFAYCPKTYAPCDQKVPSTVQAACVAVTAKVRQGCSAR